jgi:type IV pilus assembly protein PilP
MKLTPIQAPIHIPIKVIFAGLSISLLSGCFDDLDDIKMHMDQVAASTPAIIEPIPDVKKFAHVKYSGFDKRSPFLEPKPEAIIEKLSQSLDCLSPDSRRTKEPLEKYGLANLRMKGTMGYADDIWALVESSTDRSVYRVSVGNYLGIFHGKITAVKTDEVQLTEMIPDGTGCWKERSTVIYLVEAGEPDDKN